jgi:superfamily II DNA helicase RecQ
LEEILGAMARANFVHLTNAVFEKDGKSIPYRKASLTRDGEALEEIVPGDLLMKDASLTVTKPRKGRKKAAAAKAKKKRSPKQPDDAAGSGIEDALRRWRLGEAKRRGVPAFRIFSDQVLKAVADKRPATAAELLAIPGIGMSTVEKYGAQIYQLVR